MREQAAVAVVRITGLVAQVVLVAVVLATVLVLLERRTRVAVVVLHKVTLLLRPTLVVQVS